MMKFVKVLSAMVLGVSLLVSCAGGGAGGSDSPYEDEDTRTFMGKFIQQSSGRAVGSEWLFSDELVKAYFNGVGNEYTYHPVKGGEHPDGWTDEYVMFDGEVRMCRYWFVTNGASEYCFAVYQMSDTTYRSSAPVLVRGSNGGTQVNLLVSDAKKRFCNVNANGSYLYENHQIVSNQTISSTFLLVRP